ncbi:hypothetical protein FHS72_000735 [Loktanella ponticola]|uniref:Uncharacterized protein n=1 Tax=Yoonia ponticola TaxID=1524255 RepID=A0A7W9BIF8_9RHOB|nr:hypothetical protein [Yoonia ponticola]MBB5721128.1 hypothetical protein [Yoonia ponticola]
MVRLLISIVIGYCIAVLPIAIVIAGAFLWPEAQRLGEEPDLSILEVAQSTMTFAVFAYLVGFLSSLPVFLLSRLFAGLMNWVTYFAAGLAGGVTAACALAEDLYTENFSLIDVPLAGGVVSIYAQFVAVGIFSGVLYLFVERSLSGGGRHIPAGEAIL